jgi:phage tail-like protein
MSSYVLGGRAGWRAATTSNIEVKGALHATAAGTYRSTVLDSRLPGCRWDRLRFDARLAAGAGVGFSTYTSDADRGEAAMASLDEGDWTPWTWSTVNGPFDAFGDSLIRSAPGRYLWLRIALGGRTAAPAVLHGVDISYPRSTSLRMLPAVYSTDGGGRDVTERLLALFDAMRDGVKDEIRLLASVIDPRTTDAAAKRDFLDWLGGWFGLEVFRAWPEHRRRAVIGRAGELFRRRGTPDGIRLFIELALGLQVHVLEGFADRHWWFAGQSGLGCAILFGPDIVGRAMLDGSDILDQKTIDSVPSPYLDPFASRANRMTVVVAYRGEPAGDEITMLRALIDAQKPAHVAACIAIVDADLRLGVNARLGLDSIVGALRSPDILAGTALPRLGVNTTVGGRS